MLMDTNEYLFVLKVEFTVMINSAKVYILLSTKQQALSCSRADVRYVRYYFEFGSATPVCWISGCLTKVISVSICTVWLAVL